MTGHPVAEGDLLTFLPSVPVKALFWGLPETGREPEDLCPDL